ncbi:MAG: T9SS type A sorting domain-containing protein [bacterium]|nr:T9SS type A sorting domain-containing protein [bacterium]
MKELALLFFITLNSTNNGIAKTYQNSEANGKYIAGIHFPENRYNKKFSLPSLDTVYSFPTPGTWPGGLAWDGTHFWLSDNDALYIYKLTATGVVDTFFPEPASAGGLTWDGSHIWYVSEQDAKLFKLDPSTGAVMSTFNLPAFGQSDPNSWGIAWDGTYFWHSEYNGASSIIYKLDSGNGNVISSFTVPYGFILGIVWLNNYLYGVDCHSFKIYKIDTNSGSVVDSGDWPLPYALGLARKDSCWWGVSSKIPSGNQRVYELCGELSGVEEKNNEHLSIMKNCPNPLNKKTIISYCLVSGTAVSLKIYDINGKVVRTLINEEKQAGNYNVNLDAQNLPAGIYLARLNAGEYKQTIKMIVVK